jgi:flavin-dependent dehydrogenase
LPRLKKVVILGGGLAGLVSGILLGRQGIDCTLIERKSYPFHRVCGEYISNEASNFLKQNNLYPSDFQPPQLSRFQLSSVSGKSATLNLDLGGFGVSRYSFDNFLFQAARRAGVDINLNTEVHNVRFLHEKFVVDTSSRQLECDVTIGAFGKRSRLDVNLRREFVKLRSPYMGVKYHIRGDHPSDLIALHNFDGGYCGMSNIEDGKTNLCYLVHRDVVKQTGDIKAMEAGVLSKNPLLKAVFANSEFLFDKPKVINEISFETKSTVENHILMAGDSAGMIAPLCGNGMAMAIHTAKLLAELIPEYLSKKISRVQMENSYTRRWNSLFSNRLWTGRQIQKLFGAPYASDLAINLAIHIRPVAYLIMRKTHGKPF